MMSHVSRPAAAKPSTIPIAEKTGVVLSQRSTPTPMKKPTRGETMSRVGIAKSNPADRRASYLGFSSGGVLISAGETFHKEPATHVIPTGGDQPKQAIGSAASRQPESAESRDTGHGLSTEWTAPATDPALASRAPADYSAPRHAQPSHRQGRGLRVPPRRQGTPVPGPAPLAAQEPARGLAAGHRQDRVVRNPC